MIDDRAELIADGRIRLIQSADIAGFDQLLGGLCQQPGSREAVGFGIFINLLQHVLGQRHIDANRFRLFGFDGDKHGDACPVLWIGHDFFERRLDGVARRQFGPSRKHVRPARADERAGGQPDGRRPARLRMVAVQGTG